VNDDTTLLTQANFEVFFLFKVSQEDRSIIHLEPPSVQLAEVLPKLDEIFPNELVNSSFQHEVVVVLGEGELC
jgi:hypothetical protein